MDRGISATQLVEQLLKLIEEHGDCKIYKEKNGNSIPVYCVDYYRKENRFELI